MHNTNWHLIRDVCGIAHWWGLVKFCEKRGSRRPNAPPIPTPCGREIGGAVHYEPRQRVYITPPEVEPAKMACLSRGATSGGHVLGRKNDGAQLYVI